MKVRCIKTIAAHWGIFFEIGKYYIVEDTQLEDVELITDYDNYICSLKKITSLIPELISYKSEIPKELLERRGNLIEISNGFLKKIKLDRYHIRGDDGTLHQFISSSRKELISKYGSDKFNISKYIFDDYFETMSKIRNDKINKLI